jgi:hypothetical protein
MIPNPKKPRKLSHYTKQLLSIVDQYSKATGDTEPDLYEVARWAEANGLMDKPTIDPLRVMQKALVRACRQDYIEDENGEPVRRRHAVREQRGAKQMTFWPKMENMTPEKFRLSLQSRRNGMLQDGLQAERDRRYYNKHYNHGDPVEFDHNLSTDVEEHFMPTEYPDAPPDDYDVNS